LKLLVATVSIAITAVETLAKLIPKVPEPGVVIIVRSHRVIALMLFRIIATGLYPVAVALLRVVLTVLEDVMVVISQSVTRISPIRIAITPVRVTKTPTEPEWTPDKYAASVSPLCFGRASGK
jgi:hypothetical protein